MQQHCKQYQDMLWSYAAKELSPEDVKLVEEHLQGCLSCREQAEQLALMVHALREEVPLPDSFTAELHKKLSLAAEEMTAQNLSLGKRILRGMAGLPRRRGFQVLAPALACLVLVVGVFSTGLFERWNSADHILTNPRNDTPITVKNPTPSPSLSGTEDAVDSEASSHTEKTIVPKTDTLSSQPTPETSAVSSPDGETADAISTPAPAMANSESTPAQETPADSGIPAPAMAMAEGVPAPNSAESDSDPVAFAIPRHHANIVCLTVEDAAAFLDGWEAVSGQHWRSLVQDVAANEILSGADPSSIVLEVTPDSISSLMSYADKTGTLPENQGETLVIVIRIEE